MKLILDEWIVREVIDTLYIARTTFLGITGLDSPQEVAKKSAKETAITRRISKAIDIIQQSEQPSLPAELEKALATHRQDLEYFGLPCGYRDASCNGFKAGAEWQKQQMMKEAVEGVVNVNAFYQTFIQYYPDEDTELRYGDRVKLIVLKSEEL